MSLSEQVKTNCKGMVRDILDKSYNMSYNAIENMKRLIKEYIEYLIVERNASALTVQSYRHELEAFANFSREKRVENITLTQVRSYRVHLSESGLSPATQNHYVVALRSFLLYLLRQGKKVLEPSRIELAKVGNRQVTFLNRKEIVKLLSASNKLRDTAVLELLFSTGLRVAELCNLTLTESDLEQGELVVRGKGQRTRLVFLSPSASLAVKRYLQQSRPTGKLFTITPRTVQRIVKKYVNKMGINKDVTPHTMRHSFATDLLINGADLRSVQELLGHKSITTTQIYTHVTNNQLRDTYRKFHGRGER